MSSQQATATGGDILRIILAILLPPLGVFFQVGLGLHFWLNILLTLFGYVPGIIHAVWIIASDVVSSISRKMLPMGAVPNPKAVTSRSTRPNFTLASGVMLLLPNVTIWLFKRGSRCGSSLLRRLDRCALRSYK